MTGGLLEREDDLAALARAVEAGGVAVALGPPGIGKSVLLDELRARAGGAGARVLAARGAQLETGFAFGVVRALLEQPVRALDPEGRAELLGGAARHAARVLDLQDHDGAADLHSTLHGLHWLVAGLAAQCRLVLCVDDAQWADDASLRFLAYAAPRLPEVTILLGVRSDGGPTGSDALDALVAAATVVRPAPFSPQATATFLARRLGSEVGPAFAAACLERTGGSPLLLRELADTLADAGVVPIDVRADAVADALPPAVGELVLHRLSRVSTDGRVLAEALAVLGEDDPPGTARALASLEADAAVPAAEELTAAHLVDGTAPLRLRHPLLRDAALAALPPARAELLHGRAARLLARNGGAAARVVAHLLASAGGDGDPWAVQRLREEAGAAARQGVPGRATAYLRRALAEPPSRAERPGVLRELGEAELAALDPEATSHLEAALRETPDPEAHAEVALALAGAHYHAAEHAEAAAVLLEAIDQLGPEAREHQLRLEAFLGVAGRYELSTAGALRGRLTTLARQLTGATAGERAVQAVAAMQEPGDHADGLARAAAAGEALLDEQPSPEPSEGVGVVMMYVHAGDLDAAASLSERLEADARASASPARAAFAASTAGAVALDRGDLREAEERARAALDGMIGLGLAPVPTTVGQLVHVLAERGDLETAEALLVEHDLEGPVAERMLLNPLLFGRGVLRGAQGRAADAAADLRELGRRHAGWDMRRPSPPWRSLAALALAAQGEDDEARALAAEQLALSRAWGSPRSLGPALRAHALVGPPDDRLAGLEEAVACLEGTPWRLELARARCDLGAELRRLGRRSEARAALEVAMDAAHACGAAQLAERAADELRASGARPRRRALTGLDALTPSELRVARLAAGGQSNRDIAQELFVSLATVETHLTRTYRKLGVAGRDALAASGVRG